MGKDAYYFSHDSNARNDPKICAMLSVYSMEGYGWYWVIIEMLREQKSYRLRISGKYNSNALAMQMHCSPEKAAQFIQDCIHEFVGEKDEGLFQTDGDFIWSNSLLRRMEKKEERSVKAKKAAEARWDKNSYDSEESEKIEHCVSNANAMQTQCLAHAIKGKESKIKENKNIYSSVFETFWVKYPRKEEKKLAYAAWKARTKEGFTDDQLLVAADNYLAKCRADKIEPRYVKMPKTFLGPSGHIEENLNRDPPQANVVVIEGWGDDPDYIPDYVKQLAGAKARGIP